MKGELSFLLQAQDCGFCSPNTPPAPTGRWAEFDMNSFWQKSSLDSSDIRLMDFIKLPAQERQIQRQWTEIYALDIMKRYPEVITQVAPLAAQSPDAYLALGALQLKTNQPKESLVTAQKGLSLVTVDTSRLIKQGLEWVQIASLWQMNKKDLVMNYSLALKNQGVEDPGVARELHQILQKKSPSKASLSPGFDFFGGYLQGMPSRP